MVLEKLGPHLGCILAGQGYRMHALPEFLEKVPSNQQETKEKWLGLLGGMYVLGRTGPRKVFHVFRAGGESGSPPKQF